MIQRTHAQTHTHKIHTFTPHSHTSVRKKTETVNVHSGRRQTLCFTHTLTHVRTHTAGGLCEPEQIYGLRSTPRLLGLWRLHSLVSRPCVSPVTSKNKEESSKTPVLHIWRAAAVHGSANTTMFREKWINLLVPPVQ